MGVEVPTAFETVGHIAHLNLKAEQLPHKHVIGQVPCRSTLNAAKPVLQPELPLAPGADRQEPYHSHSCQQGV